MTLVDDRGRLFGRWNVVDALVGVVLLGLIPLLYAGYLLFRPPTTSLHSVEPSRIEGSGLENVTIHGTNLRPYMRVSFDAHQARGFMFSDPTKAVVGAADLPPGVYDVILYDNAQERARLPKAFEVVAPPRAQTELEVIGSFTAIPSSLASQIKPELQIEGLGRVMRVGSAQPSQTRAVVGAGELINVPSSGAVNVPAVILATCALVQRSGSTTCTAMDNALMRDAVLTVPLSGGNALFQIDQVRAAGTPSTIEVRARLSGERAVVERVRRGDRDVARANEFAAGAEVVSASAVTRAPASVIVSTQASPAATSITAGDIATVEVLLRVPANQTLDGWTYNGVPLIGGRPFMFHGPGYQVSGTVLSVAAK